ERDRLAGLDLVVGCDHRAAHRAAREVLADARVRRALELGEGWMALTNERHLRRIGLHAASLPAASQIADFSLCENQGSWSQSGPCTWPSCSCSCSCSSASGASGSGVPC